MPKGGNRYTLLIYQRMIDRWWPAIFWLGVALLALAWPFYGDAAMRLTDPWRWEVLAGLGGAAIFIALVMFTLRKSAYVQCFNDHLRLVTPFLRMNISYKRIQRVVTASLPGLFPPKSLRGFRREIIEPLAHMTAVVLELNAMPMPAATLRFFLSPFFFKDRTPHLVILVQNWMGFSTELDSLRVNGAETGPRFTEAGILSRLPKK
jgi:hypothetical protein